MRSSPPSEEKQVRKRPRASTQRTWTTPPSCATEILVLKNHLGGIIRLCTTGDQPVPDDPSTQKSNKSNSRADCCNPWLSVKVVPKVFERTVPQETSWRLVSCQAPHHQHLSSTSEDLEPLWLLPSFVCALVICRSQSAAFSFSLPIICFFKSQREMWSPSKVTVSQLSLEENL